MAIEICSNTAAEYKSYSIKRITQEVDNISKRPWVDERDIYNYLIKIALIGKYNKRCYSDGHKLPHTEV